MYIFIFFFFFDSQVPLWGLEAVYRDKVLVGYLRRADYSYTWKNSIGQA